MDQAINKQRLEELIQQAEQTVGYNESNDYEIELSSFVDKIEDEAPRLAELLHNNALVETARRFERNNLRAIDEQSEFKRLSNQATWAIFIATVSAASVVLFVSNDTDNTNGIQIIPLLLGIITLVGGAWAAWALQRVSLKRWMQSRAAAETDRLGYFTRLVRIASNDHNDDPLLLLQCLEFFRRYQLSVQQNYYEIRGRKHGQSLKKTISLGSAAAFILALGSGGAAILGAFQAELLQFAIIGIIGTALATVASRREELNQDERNSERYQRTADLLSHIRERHDEVQLAVAQGDTDVLQKYVAAVHEQLSLEHRQWLSETEAMDETIKSLSASLKKINQKK